MGSNPRGFSTYPPKNRGWERSKSVGEERYRRSRGEGKTINTSFFSMVGPIEKSSEFHLLRDLPVDHGRLPLAEDGLRLGGEHHGETGAFSHLTLHGDGAAVHLDELLG